MAQSLNPQKSPTYSPLETLAMQALRDFGDHSAARSGGETVLKMIQHANQVIEDLYAHPYWSGGLIDYYQSQADIRPIPDLILQRGMLAYHAIQQGSERAPILLQMYQRLMNQMLYTRMAGGNPPLSLSVMDKDAKGYAQASDRDDADAE